MMDNNSQDKNKNSSAYDSESDIIWERERKAPSESRQNTVNSGKRVIRTESGSTENKSETEKSPRVRIANKKADIETFDETMIYDTSSVRKRQETEKKSDGLESARIPVHRTKIQSSLKQKPQDQLDDDENIEKRETTQKPSDRILTSIPYETKQINTQPKRKADNEHDTGETRVNDASAAQNGGGGRKKPSKPVSMREIPKNPPVPRNNENSTKIVQVRSDGSTGSQLPEVREEESVNLSDRELKEKRAATKGKAKRRRKESGEGAATVLSVVWAIMYIVLVVVTGVFLGLGIVFVGNDVFAFVKEDVIVEVEIPEYATLNEVTDIFYDEGLIKYKLVFKMWANLRDKDQDLEFLAGTYQLSPTMNYDELRSEIRPKYTRNTIRITIPEGYTTDEIIDLFTSSGIGTKETFIDIINNYDFKAGGYDYWFIEELQTNGYSSDRFYRLDGYLFPDTYDFYSDSSEIAVITKLLDNFEVKFNSTYAERANELGMTVDEIVILASIIEKEARDIVDVPDISSVFHNRLKNSSVFPKLESDATIIYAMHHNTGVRPTSLESEDKYYDSPYNSYTHNGLPPGAIANPGLESIKYALYPSDTGYYYFVSDKYGEVYYASTLAEQDYNIKFARSIE